MREYKIEARGIKNPVYPAPIEMGGADDQGRKIELTNNYLQIDGRPFFAICAEAHFSRMDEALWEDEIIKMKMGGINITASYIFWIHHEEIEGEYDWSGNKNLRRYVELCKKNNMYVILRIGPFAHGECRNGGYPDWMFGRPFDIRCDDEQYLDYTRRFYEQIYKQVEGLLYQDGGPVIGVQLENEHEHASAPWEMTTENSKEWVVSGRQGEKHMATLKRLAIEAGFTVPLYTATAWGGACAPEKTVFPLWGGYAFRPWMFYDGTLKEHPATAEYLYGDFHNNEAPKYYNFDPEYPAEDFPYACCEMGGGMNVYYPYRFELPYESVGALAQVKVGSGCNFLGYYMYHGGTHPKGKKTPYLNECAVPKFSYDYQAAIGEFGQLRKSYHQLRLQHLLYSNFTQEMTAAKTFLSKEAMVQEPQDTETLRYVIRADESGRGFLFINNYQDHVDCTDQKDFAVTVRTDRGEVRIPEQGGLGLAKECCCILPFYMDLEGVLLKYAAAQPITRIRRTSQQGHVVYFFSQISGMHCEFAFEKTVKAENLINCAAEQTEGSLRIKAVDTEKIVEFTLERPDGAKVILCALPEQKALQLYQCRLKGREQILLSDCAVLVKDGRLELESTGQPAGPIGFYPPVASPIRLQGMGDLVSEVPEMKQPGILQWFSLESLGENRLIQPEITDCSTVNSAEDSVLKRPVVGSPLTSRKVVNARALIRLRPEDFAGAKRLMMKIDYEGDVGYAFINGEMFHDNFCNGAPWEIDLMPYREQLLEHGMYVYISPKKKGAYVDNSSAMAARFEVAEEQVAKLEGIVLEKIGRITLEIPDGDRDE